MPRAKSVLASMEITVAGSSHNCRFNDGHRIQKGMSRLTIKEDRTKLNYCLECAQLFLVQGSERLQQLRSEVERLRAEK